MKPGRPKRHKDYRQRKSFLEPGRYKERIERLYAKRQKLEMLESLIFTHERQPNPDHDEIKDLKRRANDLRTQLTVTSTVEPLTKQNITR